MTKEDFLKDIGNWSNHRYLLWPALEATKHLNLPVLELGVGEGSSPFLRKYCADNNLELKSFDNNKLWADQYGGTYSEKWDAKEWFYNKKYSVVLIDQAPGWHRKLALELFIQFPTHAQVIVIHDSEIEGWNASDYKVRPLFKEFRYLIDYETPKPGAWASAVSNFIDVTEFSI